MNTPLACVPSAGSNNRLNALSNLYPSGNDFAVATLKLNPNSFWAPGKYFSENADNASFVGSTGLPSGKEVLGSATSACLDSTASSAPVAAPITPPQIAPPIAPFKISPPPVNAAPSPPPRKPDTAPLTNPEPTVPNCAVAAAMSAPIPAVTAPIKTVLANPYQFQFLNPPSLKATPNV